MINRKLVPQFIVIQNTASIHALISSHVLNQPFIVMTDLLTNWDLSFNILGSPSGFVKKSSSKFQQFNFALLLTFLMTLHLMCGVLF